MFDSDDVLCRVALLNYLRMVDPQFTWGTEVGLVAALGTDDVFQRIIRLRNERHGFFTRLQCLALAMEVLGRRDSPSAVPVAADLAGFRTCLLRANALTESDVPRQKNPDETLASLYRIAHFYVTEDFPELLGRYCSIFLTHFTLAFQSFPKEGFDLQQALRERLGIDLIAYLAVGVVTWGHYFAVRVNSTARRSIYENPASFPLKLGVEQVRSEYLPFVHSALKHIAAQKNYFQSAPAGSDADASLLNYYSLQKLRNRPLFQFQSGFLMPLDMEFLQERITTGVKWLLHDYFLEQMNLTTDAVLRAEMDSQRQRVLNFWGRAFESYIYHVLLRIHGRPSEAVLLSEGDGTFGADFILYEFACPDTILFIECTCASVPLKALVSGDLELTRKALRKLFFRPDDTGKGKIRQLASSIEAYKKGLIPRLKPVQGRVTRIIPIVLFESPLPTGEPISRLYRSVIRDEGIEGSLLDDLQILSAGDLDAAVPIVRARRHSLAGLLVRKAKSRWKSWALVQWLKHEKMWCKNEDLRQAYSRLVNDSRHIFTAAGENSPKEGRAL